MVRSKSIAGAGLAVLIACAGCSSDGSSDSSFNQQDFDVVMSKIVIPALRLLNPFAVGALALTQTMAGAPAAAPGGTTSCPGGQDDLSPTYCPSDGLACRADGGGGSTTTFTGCVAQGATIDGTWILVGTPESNTSTLNLTVTVLGLEVATLEGSVASTAVGECVQEDLGGTTSLTVTITGSGSIDIDGLLTYCPTADWPSGSRNLTVTDSSDLLYQMTFDATNVATTVIKDQSSGNTIETCETNLDDAVSVCTAV